MKLNLETTIFLDKVLNEFYNKILSEQIDLDMEFAKILQDNMWELI